jgi:hypothetical protein
MSGYQWVGIGISKPGCKPDHESGFRTSFHSLPAAHVTVKPIRAELRHLLQFARLRKEMRGSAHRPKVLLTRQQVEPKNGNGSQRAWMPCRVAARVIKGMFVTGG